MTKKDFQQRYGPIALVTGSSSGIGWAFAEELAERGFDLVLTARRVERLEDLAQTLKDRHGTRAQICQADLSDPAAPARILEETAGVDIGLVVSNAGFNMKGTYETKKTSALFKLLMVNCHAPMQLAHGFIPRLKARGHGGIVFTSSIEGLMGHPYSTAYSASKALVNSLGEGLWGELIGSGVDVLSMCPGATESEAMNSFSHDTSKLDLQPARECARLTLENIANGPVYSPHASQSASMADRVAMPRRQALTEMAESMKGYA